MNLNFVILILFNFIICSLAVEKETAECISELNLDKNELKQLLTESDAIFISLSDYDQKFIMLFQCILEKTGAFKDGSVQPNELITLINSIYDFGDGIVRPAVEKCKDEHGDNDIDTILKVSACLEIEMDFK